MSYMQHKGHGKAAKVVESVAKWLNLCPTTVVYHHFCIRKGIVVPLQEFSLFNQVSHTHQRLTLELSSIDNDEDTHSVHTNYTDVPTSNGRPAPGPATIPTPPSLAPGTYGSYSLKTRVF